MSNLTLPENSKLLAIFQTREIDGYEYEHLSSIHLVPSDFNFKTDQRQFLSACNSKRLTQKMECGHFASFCLRFPPLDYDEQ